MGLVHLNRSQQLLVAVLSIVVALLAGCSQVAAQASTTTTTTTTTTTSAPTTSIAGTSVTSAWPPLKFSRYEYIFIPRAESWASAQDLCDNSYNASLVSIHSQEEQNFLLREFVETQVPQNFPVLVPPAIYPAADGVSHRGIWIGLRNNIKVGGVWSDNSTVDYLNWIAKKPDNYKSQEGCTQIYVDNDQEGWYGMWDDLSCEAAMPFVCKRLVGLNKTSPTIEYEGNDYTLHYAPLTLADAEKSCQLQDDGHVVSITNEEEGTFIMSAFVGGQLADDFSVKVAPVYPSGFELDGIWLGLVNLNTSEWAWLDRNHSAYRDWAPTKPDNWGNVTERCAHLWVNQEPPSAFGLWNDVYCGSAMAYICKRKASGNATSWLGKTNAPAPPLDLNSTASQLGQELGLGADNSVPRKGSTTKVAVIAGVIGGVVALAVVCCLVCKLRRHRPKKKEVEEDPEREIETMHLTPPNSQLFSHQDPRTATPQQKYGQPPPASRQGPYQYPPPNGTPPQQYGTPPQPRPNGQGVQGVQRALPPSQRPNGAGASPSSGGAGPSSSYTHQRPPPAPMQRPRPRS